MFQKHLLSVTLDLVHTEIDRLRCSLRMASQRLQFSGLHHSAPERYNGLVA
jgi:hypothetical protein